MDNRYTKQIAEFIVRTEYESVPSKVLEVGKRLIFDNLGLALAGSRAECGRIVQGLVERQSGVQESRVLGTTLTAPMELAALANGVQAHADDYDDTQIASLPDRVTGLLVHPTTPVLAAALAVGEALGRSGRDLLMAYTIGLEVECKLAEAIHPEHYQRGFHSTGTFGALGAMAAASRLMGLSVDQVVRALGIAASMSAGLRANFGTMTKPYHAGRAAENGVRAAQLAQNGFESSPDILDSKWGFFQIMGGGFDANYLASRVGNPWQLETPGVAIKPYPCGSLGHPTMDAVRELVIEHDVSPEDVDRIDIAATSHIVNALRYTRPTGELQAKFSLQYGVTSIVLRRKAGIKEYTDAAIQSPEARAFIEKVNCYVDEAVEKKGFDKMYTAVTVRLKDGRTLETEASISRGYPERPLTKAEQVEKFAECADGTLDETAIEEVWSKVEALETVAQVTDITSALSHEAQSRRVAG